MPKAIICVGTQCEEIIQLEDGTTIHQPRKSCISNYKPSKTFLKDYLKIADKSTRTVRLKTQLFKGIKVGTEVPLDFTEPEEKPDEKPPEEPILPTPAIDE